MPTGNIKPSGPQTIDKTHPRAQGLVAFLFDNGDGTYSELVSGMTVVSMPTGSASQDGVRQQIIGGVSTPWGVLSQWPGLTVQASFAQPGICNLIQLNLTDTGIPEANDLASKSAGAGNTLSMGVIRLPGLINNSYSLLGGRPGLSAGEVQPFIDWAFIQDGNSNVIRAQCLGPGPTQMQVGSSYELPDNVYIGLNLGCTNDAQGVGIANFFVNGVNNYAPMPNVSMFSYDPTKIAETDLGIGCCKHMQTTETVNVFGGYLPWLAVYNRELTAVEKLDEAVNPYIFVIPATGAPPVTTGTFTVSADGTQLTLTSGGSLTDTGGNVWTFGKTPIISGDPDLQILKNGQQAYSGGGVLMTILAGVIWVQNSPGLGGDWFIDTGSSWKANGTVAPVFTTTPVTPPSTAALVAAISAALAAFQAAVAAAIATFSGS